MVLAIAALLLHVSSGVPAVPAAAAAAANSAKAAASAPAPSISDLPEAPVPSVRLPDALPGSSDSNANSLSQTAIRQPVVLRAAALDSAGNDTQTLSTIHIPESNKKPFERVGVESMPSRKKWLALSIAQSSAASFDAYSTRRAIQTGASEADPFMRPFASSPAIYAAIQVAPVVLDFTARHMQHSELPVMRHTWWLPQTLGTGLYLFSGVHNMQVANRH